MTSQLTSGLAFFAVQTAGVAITTCLMLLLARQIDRTFVRLWAAAWVTLAVGLASLLACVVLPEHHRAWLLPYFGGHYGFAILLTRGIGAYRSDRRVAIHYDAWLVSIVAAWSVLLTLFAETVDLVFRAHAVAMACLLLVALHEAWKIRPPGHHVGRGVTLLSLSMLALDLLVQAGSRWAHVPGGSFFLELVDYNSLIDLVLLTGLGFGLVVLVMELITAELAQANRELAAARDRMEARARVDPLTNALNRHAFNTLFVDRAPAQASGSVVLVDIDNLKQLNDTRGHGAGDQAIRDAARVIRHALRADDLVFRWGGDEFLAILFGMSERDADARFRALRERSLGDPSAPRLSWGVASFAGEESIGAAIETADQAMYASRQRRRDRAAS